MTPTPDKAKRLGRGLDALIGPPSAGHSSSIRLSREDATTTRDGFRRILVSAIAANPLQPRKVFDAGELAELRASIEANGLLQPLLVRPRESGYELVAGERRFRAIQQLGWKDVPAQVRDLDDQDVLTLALIENLQRSDLDPIEEAEGYQDLISRFSLTQQQVATAVGRERSTIANSIRLLGLPAAVRTMVRTGELSLGHARTLLGLTEQAEMVAMAREIVAQGLTVREVERRVRHANTASSQGKHNRRAAKGGNGQRPVELKPIEEQLRRRFQTDAVITASGSRRGDIRLSFYSADDLERLLDILLGKDREVI
ncbi:MAG: ParB/RepB/Spo0J family partition protein [Gemmatimonadaceae bacterium]|nr:ParB/RepB/Spo0J family partition protein [Gemmatimonadaceae bacterium]